jgi:cAMP-dependent protein kinase regulator
MMLTHDSILSLRHEGRVEEALRAALAFLHEDGSDHYAWYSAASLCVELGAAKVGVEGLAAVGEELAESGGLPMALVCIREIEDAGADASDLIAHVALLYGRGSTRVKNRLLPPPPLPPRVDEEKVENFRCERGFLVEQADRLMGAAAESARLARQMTERPPALPFFPMFGSLGMEGFLRLTSAFAVRRFGAGEALMTQGQTSDDMWLLARGEVVVELHKKEQVSELAVLGPGALMGEMGMVARTPRSATVRARTHGIGLVAEIDEIESIADDLDEVAEVIVKFCEIRMMENLMSVSPILEALEPRDRARVVRMFDHVYLDEGETAIERGDPSSGIYLVVSGAMSVIREPEKGGGREDPIYLATLEAGDVFGEISTVMNKPATATVRAARDAALLFLPRDRFMDVTRRFPTLFQRIYEISTEREEEISRLAHTRAVSADDLIEE